MKYKLSDSQQPWAFPDDRNKGQIYYFKHRARPAAQKQQMFSQQLQRPTVSSLPEMFIPASAEEQDQLGLQTNFEMTELSP